MRQVVHHPPAGSEPLERRLRHNPHKTPLKTHTKTNNSLSPHRYDPTIEDSYSVTRKVDGHQYQLHLTDTAGQEEYRGLFSTSNLHSDAFLLVYDITIANTLPNLQHFNDMISIEAEERADRGAVPPVKMVV